MWTLIARIILKNRILLLVAVAIITAFMGYHASFVNLEYDFPAMLPESDSTYIQNEKFKEQFGENAAILIIGFSDKEFFKYKKFNDYICLIDSIKNVNGVVNVISVSNTYNLVKNNEKRKFELIQIFPDKVKSQHELDSLKTVFYSLPFYRELLFEKSDFLIMGITLEKNLVNTIERIYVCNAIEHLVNNFGESHKLKIHYSGLPYTRTRIGEIIQQELYLFIFLAAVVTAILLFLFFRSLKVVLFSLIVVGTSVLWALGTLHIFGYNLTVLSGMIPPLLIVIGIPNIVFLLNKYHNEYKNHGNKIKSLQRVINKVGGAIFLTNLTTAIGFATFIITNNRLLVEFGIVAALNIMGLFLISILFVPIIFSFLKPPRKRHINHLDNPAISWIIRKFCYLTENRRSILYLCTVLLVVVSFIGISKIKTTGYLVDDISKEDPVYKDLKFFEEQINGVIPLEISIDSRKKNGILNIDFIKKIDELQTKLKEYPELSKSISIANGVKFARQAYFNGKEKHYKLPSKAESNFIFSYITQDKDKSQMLKSFVNSTASIARVSCFIGDIGANSMIDIQDKIKKDVNSIFPHDNYDIIVTGSCFLFTRGTSYLIKNLFVSLGLAIILISFFMAGMFYSLRMAVISLVPNILPLIFTAGIMGYFEIAIKPSTLLVFSIAFGISVDNAIHFLAKYGQELRATKLNIAKSVILALQEAGISIIYTGIILFFGFGIFFASKFGGTKALGLLVAITILLAVFANLLILPSLLLSSQKQLKKGKFLKEK